MLHLSSGDSPRDSEKNTDSPRIDVNAAVVKDESGRLKARTAFLLLDESINELMTLKRDIKLSHIMAVEQAQVLCGIVLPETQTNGEETELVKPLRRISNFTDHCRQDRKRLECALT